MTLIPCPACGRQISVEAIVCPQCGHPACAAAAEPKCYACAAPATTRFQSYGTLSCALHLQSIFVAHGDGGSYELQCESCRSSAEAWYIFGLALAGIALMIGLVIIGCLAAR